MGWRTGGGLGGGRKGFLRSLLDLSFTSFVTGRVVAFLYVISVVFVVLYSLFMAVYLSAMLGAFLSAAAGSGALGWVAGVVLFLILAPVFLLITVVYVRVLLEIVVVLFRISDNTAETSRRLGILIERPEPSGQTLADPPYEPEPQGFPESREP